MERTQPGDFSVKNRDVLQKVVAWRFISILVTLLVLYLGTGDVKSATGITVVLHAVLVACHYTFEKIWAKKYESR